MHIQRIDCNHIKISSFLKQTYELCVLTDITADEKKHYLEELDWGLSTKYSTKQETILSLKEGKKKREEKENLQEQTSLLKSQLSLTF